MLSAAELDVSARLGLVGDHAAQPELHDHAFGYARVSTALQEEALQRDALEAAGVDRVYVDRISGATASRPALDELLGQLRAGDTVVMWRLDRLGRSLRPLIDVGGDLEERGGFGGQRRPSPEQEAPPTMSAD